MDIIKSLTHKHLDYINQNNEFTLFYIDESTYYILLNKINTSCRSLTYKVENKSGAYEIVNFKDYIFKQTHKNGAIYIKDETSIHIPWDYSDNIRNLYKKFKQPQIHDPSWIDLIEQKVDISDQLSPYNITVVKGPSDHDSSNSGYTPSHEHFITTSKQSNIITYKFGPGIYKFNQQIWLSPNTTIKGANIVNTEFPSALTNKNIPSLSGDLINHTIFLAVNEEGSCFTQNDVQDSDNITKKGHIRSMVNKFARPGFLLNTNTTLQNFLIHGCFDSACEGEYAQGGICCNSNIGGSISNYINTNICTDKPGLAGGGIFELPGCIGNRPVNENEKCIVNYNIGSITDNINIIDNIIDANAFLGDSGLAIENVSITDIRVNSLIKNAYNNSIRPSNVLFWSAGSVDDKAHTNINLKNIVCLQTYADGINVHGNVDNFSATNIVVTNAGDDTFAIWGGVRNKGTYEWCSGCAHKNYYGPKNTTFTNILGHQYDGQCSNPGQDCRPYGSCLGTFGFEGSVDVHKLYCQSLNQNIGHIDNAYCADYNGTIQMTNINSPYQPTFSVEKTSCKSAGCIEL